MDEKDFDQLVIKAARAAEAVFEDGYPGTVDLSADVVANTIVRISLSCTPPKEEQVAQRLMENSDQADAETLAHFLYRNDQGDPM